MLVLVALLVALPWAVRARPVAGVLARPAGTGRPGDEGDVGDRDAGEGRRAEAGGRGLDPVLLLELVDAALASGASLPRALRAVGVAAGGPVGEALDAAGAALVLGASWHAAWAGAPDEVHDVRDALAQAWVTGAAPGPALRARAAAARRERRRRARTAGAALGVHLVLPLGLCFLPAFALLGLAPLVLGLGSGLLDGLRP